MAIVWLEMGPYPIDVGFVGDNKSYYALLKKHKVQDIKDGPLLEDSPATHTHFQPPERCPISLVSFDFAGIKNKKMPILADFCAHEATHVWQTAKDYLGEKSPGREQEAYFIGHVTAFLLTHLLKKIRRTEYH